MPRACSVGYCDVVKMSADDVIAARAEPWPTYQARRKAEYEGEYEAECTRGTRPGL